MARRTALVVVAAFGLLGLLAMPTSCSSRPDGSGGAAVGKIKDMTRVIKKWTKVSRDKAIPRELFIDGRGLAYIANGTVLMPYGHADLALEEVKDIRGPQGKADVAPTAVPSSRWTGKGLMQTAVGRLYFDMPTSADLTKWAAYVCSGSVVTDPVADRSIILTAAHCVYEDRFKAFARNVLFIPNQAASGSRTDRNCRNDVMGCWVPSFGVVERAFAESIFPASRRSDYAFYVVPSGGAHSAGKKRASDSLETAAGSLVINFGPPGFGNYTRAFGYPYNVDPNLMYCADGLATQLSTWFLPSCNMLGGASGGPWIQPLSTANPSGPVISLNSWRFASSGMGGPRLSTAYTPAKLLYEFALATPFASISSFDGQEGAVRL